MHRGRERKELRSQMKDAWNKDKQKKDKDEGFTREGFRIKAATSKQMGEPGIKPNKKMHLSSKSEILGHIFN